MRAGKMHRVVVMTVLLLALISIGVWVGTRERLPAKIRIATAVQGGLYHTFAEELKTHLELHTGRQVELIGTAGSIENRALLLSGEAQLAILQAACVPLDGIEILAPLYPEVMHVLVRRGEEVQAIEGLAGLQLALGLPRSGMRESARILLDHYGIDLAGVDSEVHYFGKLPESPEVVGAIVMTGLDNPDLTHLLENGDYKLLSIDDAAAIALLHPLFHAFDIPRGLYHEGPPVPAKPLPTLATTAVLAAAPDCGDLIVEKVLAALYEQDLRTKYPLLIQERQALERAPVALHPAARRYLDPYGRLSVLSTALEALAGLKELLVGLIALGYLGWDKLRDQRNRRHEQELQEQKDHLDEYLQRTMAIERRLTQACSRSEIEQALREVTEIKLEALEKLTLEALRGDRMFSIFLMQCSDVANRLQGCLSALPLPS